MQKFPQVHAQSIHIVSKMSHPVLFKPAIAN